MGNKIKVLVTGATGFLGGEIARYMLRKKDVEVILACRNKFNLNFTFEGEIREGSLLDPVYRKSVVQGVDVICHAGTWGTFWGHPEKEYHDFYLPTIDLIENAKKARVGKFLMSSTIALSSGSEGDQVNDDFHQTIKTKFWPHLDYLVDVDAHMKKISSEETKMITMRLGHFVGRGVQLGIIPALAPRLKTFMVPWINHGQAKMALVSGEDMAKGFYLASVAKDLLPYESFNICGPDLPSSHEVISFISKNVQNPGPLFSVSRGMAYGFGWLMEKLFPVLPGKSPFLTRSLVYVSENRNVTNNYANKKLGYVPTSDWRSQVMESIEEIKENNFPWPFLGQR